VSTTKQSVFVKLLHLLLLVSFFQVITLDLVQVTPSARAPTEQVCPPDDPPDPAWKFHLIAEGPPEPDLPEPPSALAAPGPVPAPRPETDRLTFSGLSPPGS
jgi:hypothetical protein